MHARRPSTTSPDLPSLALTSRSPVSLFNRNAPLDLELVDGAQERQSVTHADDVQVAQCLGVELQDHVARDAV